MWQTLLTAVLIINEIMASNTGEVMSPATNFDSWIEVYNPGDAAVNLGGMYLSDDSGNLKRWRMPQNIGRVAAKGYKVIWLGSNDIEPTQATFKLDCDGGTICISDTSGQLIASQDYPAAKSRTAWARQTDGTGEFGWTATPTPGATNATAQFATERLNPPVVDQGSQLFNSTLIVKVTIPRGATLVYTTDGSVPQASGKVSANGVFIIDETTNYVFRLFQDGKLPSVPVTRSYIKSANEYTIPVISIVGNEKYFTDPVWGIDVAGTNGKTGNGSDTPVNWNMDWDRPVNFSYISPTDGMLFNQDVNISVSGGWTRKASPRSMKLKSNKIFDGQNHLDYPFFPQKPYIRSKTLLVRNGGNDVWDYHARFTDPALSTVIQRSGIDLDVQSFVQVAEYINGKFKGVLNLREPNNDKFVYANHGYDDDEIDMFENNTFKNGTQEVFNRLCLIAADSDDPTTYEQVKSLLDVDEFINYMAVELYLGNDDWPDNNLKAYRSRQDGRYRYVCFDLDFAFNNRGRNSFSQALDNFKSVKTVSLFLNLLENDTFRRQFIDTYCIVGGSVFEKNRTIAIIDELADAMRPMSTFDGYLPDKAADHIKNAIRSRLETMTSRLQQYQPMKLSNTRAQSVELSSDTEGATILVNGIKVPYSTFNGRLFQPVTLEAKAPAGYTCIGWKKSASTTTELIKNNESWKYYDQGEAPANWNAASFNDNTWKSGKAPLGYKMSGIKTTVSYGSDANRKNPTTYFRKSISLSKAPSASDLFQLNYQVDDGFIVYVNGTEAGRVNMSSGTVGYSSFSSTYAGDTPLTGSLELPATLFRSGSNVIAVEVHNTSFTSSDLYWDAELLTTVGDVSEEWLSTEATIDLPADNKVLLTACFAPSVGSPMAGQGLTPIRINEVSAANGIYVNDYFKRNDWLELYNTTSQDIDLAGMYLSDDPGNPLKAQISNHNSQISTVIPAHGYLVVWCDKLEPLTMLHTTFKLSAEGGEVLLTAADKSWTDHFVYSAMNSDQTAGRYPDGAAEVYLMNVPTIAKTNITSGYATEIEQPGETAIRDIAATGGPGISYTGGSLLISSAGTDAVKVSIYSLAGHNTLNTTVPTSGGRATLSVAHLHDGVYMAAVTTAGGRQSVCKFIITK